MSEVLSEEKLEAKTEDLEEDAEKVTEILIDRLAAGEREIVPTRFRNLALKMLEVVAGGASYPPEVYARVREMLQHQGLPISFEVFDRDWDVGSGIPSLPGRENVHSDIVAITKYGKEHYTHPALWEEKVAKKA